MNRAVVWLCLLSMTLLSGCTRPSDEVIRMGLANAPTNLDPRYATDATSARVNRLLYARLVDFDEHLLPVRSGGGSLTATTVSACKGTGQIFTTGLP